MLGAAALLVSWWEIRAGAHYLVTHDDIVVELEHSHDAWDKEPVNARVSGSNRSMKPCSEEHTLSVGPPSTHEAKHCGCTTKAPKSCGRLAALGRGGPKQRVVSSTSDNHVRVIGPGQR